MRKRPIRLGVLQPIGSISFGQMIDLKRKRIDRRKAAEIESKAKGSNPKQRNIQQIQEEQRTL